MRVTVVPEDKTIIVDGEVLQFAFTADANIHAIQWYGDHGTVEKKIGPAEAISDFAAVQPFVAAHAAEADRIAAEAAASQQASA